jgi:molecular chaperone GrpE
MSAEPLAPETPETPAAAVAPSEAEQLRAEVAESQDKLLRALAEAENIRRRAETDVANAHKYAIERFANEMLAVRDSLERARAMDLKGEGVIDKVIEGLDLTLKLMDSGLQKFAIQTVDPQKGDKFDPNRHQAMSLIETSEVPPQHVVVALQKGYLLNDRLLRPALVMVAKAPAA